MGGFVTMAAAKAAQTSSFRPAAAPAPVVIGGVPPTIGALDPTGKIRRQITWLNTNVQLAEPINCESVVAGLSALDVTSAMKILKDVEEGAAGIKNPTGYVAAAAARAVGQGSYGGYVPQ